MSTLGAAPPLPECLVETARLRLEPLRMAHAEELVTVLEDPALHTYVGGRPATLPQLRARIDVKTTGVSADGVQRWLNWVIRTDVGDVAGYVQATVVATTDKLTAELAWVVGAAHQGRGVATEAAAGMVRWLGEQGVHDLVAHIHPDNVASQVVARRTGLHPTDVVVDDEVEWVGQYPDRTRPPDS